MADRQIYNFNNEIEELEILPITAKLTVIPTDDSAITAEYVNPGEKPEFIAILNGKRLVLKEKLKFGMLGFKPSEDITLTVRLPERMFKRLKISAVSGVTEISGVNAERFELNTVSGIAEVRDFRAEKFSINSVSGKTRIAGASGEGDISLTSGTVDVAYSDWNADLKIKAVSGSVNVTLPADSGADIKFDGVSGSLKTNLNNSDGSWMNLGRGTNGAFGGENRHKVSVNSVSGSVTLAKETLQTAKF